MLIDYQTICDGLHANSICELENGTPIPVSTARRLCCDANVFPVVLAGNGEVLDVGQSVRTATPARTFGVRHQTFEFFRNGGRTSVSNLLPLCEKHHHLVHEGGWRLTMTSGRVATWRRPDGTIWHTEQTIDRRPSQRPEPVEQHQPTLC